MLYRYVHAVCACVSFVLVRGRAPGCSCVRTFGSGAFICGWLRVVGASRACVRAFSSGACFCVWLRVVGACSCVWLFVRAEFGLEFGSGVYSCSV